MRYACPECKEITKRDDGRKYLPGTSREHRSSAHVLLRKRECSSRKGCGHQFILRTEYPLNPILEPTTAISYNWSEYQNALKVKPGIPVGGTTYSEATLLYGRDTADAWWQILGYEKPPEIKRNARRVG